MATEVVMPQMGESIAEGTITKWLKNVGDHVDRDEPLFEISTDKVDAEIPSPAAGTLTEVRFKEGDTVEVNTVVAVLDGADSPTTPPTSTPAGAESKITEAPKEPEPEPTIAEPPAAAPEANEESALPTGTFADSADSTAAPEPTPPAELNKPVVSENKPSAPAPKSAPPRRANGAGAASVEDLRRTRS